MKKKKKTRTEITLLENMTNDNESNPVKETKKYQNKTKNIEIK